MSGCKASCLHRARVQLYYDDRDAQWERATQAARSEDPESEEIRAFFRDPNLPAAYPSEDKVLFKNHLIHTKGENMARRAPEQPEDAEEGYATCGSEAQRDSQGSWWHVGFHCGDSMCKFTTTPPWENSAEDVA